METLRYLTKTECKVLGLPKESADKILVAANGADRWTPEEAWNRFSNLTGANFDFGSKRRMYQLIDFLTDYVVRGYNCRWCGSQRMAANLRDLAKTIEFLVECDKNNLDPMTEKRRINREWGEKVSASMKKGANNG